MTTSKPPPDAPREHDPPEPAPPGVATMAIVRWAFVALAFVAAVWTWTGYVRGPATSTITSAAAARTKYHCPMHPQIVADEPGECPICHMSLVPIVAERPAPAGSTTAAPGPSSVPAPGSVPPGTVPITLAEARVQSIGVRTALAESRDAGGTVRVTATVAAPEQGASELHVRAAGFVERISVRETGVKVGAGQELIGLYSPDVFQAESELLAAKSFGDQGARSVAASRQRLELLGMSPRAIDEVLASGRPMRIIAVPAPAGGYVTKKNVVLGSYVTPETTLYEIVDLSRVYVVAEVFERDVASLQIGTEGRFTPSAGSTTVRTAKVDLIYPQLDAAARTTRIRMQVKNDDLALRPGQYGQVELVLAPQKAIVVPRDAVVDTGRVAYVFVDEGGGRFTPRVVTVGKNLEDATEILAGVSAGERVVAGATFLVDSESRLQASLAHSAESPARSIMIGRLIDLSARHRGLVVLFYVVAALGAFEALRRVKLDAIPDLSDPQVIVFTEWKGRSPTLVEDQVTYPIASRLLAAPHVEAVRGYSMFGMSFVYVVFEEGTDVYWARSRVLESMSSIQGRLPEGALPQIGPDATAVGWVYEYALVDRTGRTDLAELRSLQDFTLRYALESVPGVAQVASVGGFEKQFQVTADPDKLRAYGVTLDEVAAAVRGSNAEVGGRVLEMSGREYFVRGRGYLENLAQLDGVVVRAQGGTPVRVRDVARVQFGPDIRRGIAELDGQGEAVGAVVATRYGENALDVIERVKAKLGELGTALPPGVEIVPTYDRSGLIHRSIATLRTALVEEGVTVALVILLFLLHFRSALLPILSMPLAVLLAFLPMWLFDIPSTIMSLGGIAIALGATVDAEIVMIEACHKKLEQAPPGLSAAQRAKLLHAAAKEVTPAIFFSLLIIAASFLPVFGLNGQAGRMFRPLAYTKTFVMLSAAILSVTFAPAIRDLLLRGRIRSEAQHPVSRAILRVYAPFVHVALRRPVTTLAIGLLALASAVPLWLRLGTEFMPPLNEGDVLYMPTTLPNVSVEEAKRQLELQDRALAAFPEVARVFGKAGRAETPTDPAPLSMVETIVQLKPPATWPKVHHDCFYSRWAPAGMRSALGAIWPEETTESWDELVAKMNAKLQQPGWTNAFTMPIKTRLDMLSTGIRTPVGLKVFSPDLASIEETGTRLETILRGVPGTRSALYERTLGGSYVDVVPNRDAIARYGLSVEDVARVVEGSIGGEPVTVSVDGRRRYGVNVRYKTDFRSSPDALREVLVPLKSGAGSIPLGELADVRIAAGPPMLREEAGTLVGYVYVDVDPSRDIGGYVEDAKRAVAAARARGDVELAAGTYVEWTGQYELLEQMRARMKLLVPLALVVIALLLYFQFRDLTEVAIVFLSIPFALVGSVWLLYLLDYRLSTAVWVGIIALVGLAAQTGVVMIVYIDHAFAARVREGKLRSLEDIIKAHTEGTVQRVRPKLMTVATMLIGLVPLLWSTGSGADVMKRIAAPMVGGLLSSAFLTLELIPVVYTYWRYAQLRRAERTGRPLAEICGIPLAAPTSSEEPMT